MNPTKHTPTPCKIVEWENINLFDRSKSIGYHIVMADGRKVLVNDKDLAELILRAVNSHEALLEAARALVDSIKSASDINQGNLAPKISILREAISQAEAQP